MFVKGIWGQGEFKISLRESKDAKMFLRSCSTLEVGCGGILGSRVRRIRNCRLI